MEGRSDIYMSHHEKMGKATKGPKKSAKKSSKKKK
jgi:hypothetical protein